MGTLSRLPDDVLTTRVACYFSRGTEEYLSLRALCASGRDVACRAIRRAEKQIATFYHGSRSIGQIAPGR